jgi:hypothetical protein
MTEKCQQKKYKHVMRRFSVALTFFVSTTRSGGGMMQAGREKSDL